MEDIEKIKALIDRFVANKDLTGLGHWYGKNIKWIKDYIMNAASVNGEVFKQRVLNTARRVQENENMDNVKESTTTASVGGQYVTPFFLKKRKMNEDGSASLEYGTYRDLFKYIVSVQMGTENEEFAHALNDYQLKIAMNLQGQLDQEVADEDLDNLESLFTQFGVPFEKGEENDFVSGDVNLNDGSVEDLSEVDNKEMTNIELFEICEGIIEMVGKDSPHAHKLVGMLESIINVEEPHGVVEYTEMSELYNLVREIESGSIEDYFTNEVLTPSLNEEKVKAETVLNDVHKENDKNTPEEIEPLKGEEGEVDSENQKPEPELGDGESEFRRASKGMEDIDYDAISSEDKARHKELIDQDITSDALTDEFGNKIPKMTNPNAMETDVAKDLIKTAEENSKKDLEDPFYVKDPQPVKTVKEDTEKDCDIIEEGEDYVITRGEMKVIKEEVEVIKSYLNFNPKQSGKNTQKNKKDVLDIMRKLNKK